MERECPKCGYKNPEATGDANEICPACSVVYSKAALIQARERVAEEQRTRHRQKTTQDPWRDRWAWGVARTGAIAALAQLFYTMARADSAWQQAGGACVAIGLAVIPYCLAKSLTRRPSDN